MTTRNYAKFANCSAKAQTLRVGITPLTLLAPRVIALPLHIGMSLTKPARLEWEHFEGVQHDALGRCLRVRCRYCPWEGSYHATRCAQHYHRRHGKTRVSAVHDDAVDLEPEPETWFEKQHVGRSPGGRRVFAPKLGGWLGGPWGGCLPSGGQNSNWVRAGQILLARVQEENVSCGWRMLTATFSPV